MIWGNPHFRKPPYPNFKFRIFIFLFYLSSWLSENGMFFFRPGFYATPQPLAKVVRVVWTINDYHLRMFVYHWNAQRNTSTDPNKSPTKCNPFKHMKATLVYPNLHTYNPLKPKTFPFHLDGDHRDLPRCQGEHPALARACGGARFSQMFHHVVYNIL